MGQRQRAFGEASVDATPTLTNNLRFPGQYFDQETGTHYNFLPGTMTRVPGDTCKKTPSGWKGELTRTAMCLVNRLHS